MPKLNKEMQKRVNDAPDGFEAVDDGVYHMRLRKVEASDQPGGSGYHYWTWEFEIVEEPYIGRRQWTNTSLSPAADFKMKETFKAFDAGMDTDTDDLCGQIVKGAVSTRTIQEGKRKGEITNQIDKLMPADPDFELPETAAVGGGSEQPEAEDLF